jgi:protein O-GlcNAc transferase
MSPITVQQAFEAARKFHQAGRLADADRLYRQVLAVQPQHAEALHLRGMLAGQAGHGELAVHLLQQASELSPGSSLVHYNLATALLRSNGKLAEAIAAFRKAIVLRPNYAEAHNNLGIALSQSGRFDESIAAFRHAISLRPDYAPGFSNLGDALLSIGKTNEAIAAYRQAIAIQPTFADARNNMGNALLATRQVDAAVTEYQMAIALQPQRAEFHSNLGNALKDNKQLRECIAAYRQAIALAPQYQQAHYNLANVLKETGQIDEAIASYQRAIALRPDSTESHYNYGNALKDAGQIDAAIAEYRKAIALNPNLPEPGDNLVYAMLYHPAIDARAIAEELRHWNLRHSAPLQPSHVIYPNDRDPDRRLRIGYVGADFREHCQAMFLLPLFSSHDRGQVELFCYSNVRSGDARTEEFRRNVEHWREIFGKSDEAVAALIREDQIDILVDLTLHMAGNRLLTFARKPAPVQVTWLGYPGSTGLTTIDYRLSDPHLDPFDGAQGRPRGIDESVYSEKIIRLPDSFWCYDPLDGRSVACNELPAVRNGCITFGCLNNFCKINDGVLDLWAQILMQVKNSRLLLLAPPGSPRQRTLDRLAGRGISGERIEFTGYQPRTAYLVMYRRIDIGLDTFPYNGHTTSLDAFWMGVPVVTLVGKTPVSRAGFSQLSNLGLAELAGDSPEQFVKIAVGLAEDIPKLREMRGSLRNRLERSPLMDAPRFARNMEAAYRQMWHAWCQTTII